MCVGGTYTKDAQTGVERITLGLGGEATCTITNNDQPGTIIVQKVTKPALVADELPLRRDGDRLHRLLVDGPSSKQHQHPGAERR